MSDLKLTTRQRDALQVWADDPWLWTTPAGFAYKFWPDKQWARSNGPYGLGPDASGRHGGRMLTRLHKMGLVDIRDYDGGYEARISALGCETLRDGGGDQ